MTTRMQYHPHALPAPSSPGPLLWVPLDEVRQTWADFAAEALSCPALLAISSAFAALSWETSALRHHRTAYQAQQRGGLFQQAAACWLDRVVQDLSEAVRDWRCVLLWLERLASGETLQAHTEPLERVRALSEQAAAQQERLLHLLGQVQHEWRASGRGLAAGAGAATVGAQEKEQGE